MHKEKTTWDVLSAINVNDKVEKKGNLTYLSWAWAWGVVKGHFPTTSYRVIEHDGKPYLHVADMGYLVQTEVTIDGETIAMHLPVMNNKNQAIKSGATMTDINKAIMRCLAKNLAMFGLGHYIYAGEDLPTEEATTPKRLYSDENLPTEKATTPRKPYSDVDLKNNLEMWKGLVYEGKATPQAIIDKVLTKHELTEDQKAKIMGLVA